MTVRRGPRPVGRPQSSPGVDISAGTGAFLALFFVAFVAGCSACQRSSAIATLKSESGAVDRDTKASVGKWRAAAVRDEFFVGDGVRTEKGAKATVTLGDRSDLALEESTIIRFLERAPGAHEEHLSLEMGEAVVQTGDEALTLRTDFGVAVIEPGTHLSLEKNDTGARYEVSVGVARFEGTGKDAVVLHPGEGIAVGIGAATIEPYAIGKTAPPEPPPSAAPSASAEPSTSAAPAEPPGSLAVHVQGAGVSMRVPGATAFTKLAPGDSGVAPGSTLRLPAGTTVDVALGAEKAELRGDGEFVVGEPGKAFVAAASGGVLLTNAANEVQISVPGGAIVTKLGASATVGVHADTTQVSVSAGSVVLRSGDGNDVELGAGETGKVARKGETEVEGRGPGYVDFVAGSGGSFAIHDPSPPTAIGFSTGDACPNGAVVSLVGRPRDRSRGTGIVSVLVPTGAHRYEVHCVGQAGVEPRAASSGTVTVMHDGGTARLPRTAPATLVDADGRSYTVLYQNLLPKISVRWASAPAAAPYSLSVTSSGGPAQSFSSGSPSYSFASGSLKEGEHHVQFRAADGTSSKDTRVDVRFDNATPTATLTSPANGSFSPGSSVSVSGVALEGWKISAAGKELPLDRDQRFSGDVTAPAGQRALAILFENPRRGVQYYLRRSAPH